MNDYLKQCSKQNGGIRYLLLIAANDIDSIDYSNGEVTNITLKAEKEFARYEFREDEAEFREEMDEHYAFMVEHTLSFSLSTLDSNSLAALGQLKDNSCDGIIALVTTNNGTTLLVGYSAYFGLERPLRLKNVLFSSGKSLGHSDICSITLHSSDTSSSMVYIGTPFV